MRKVIRSRNGELSRPLLMKSLDGITRVFGMIMDKAVDPLSSLVDVSEGKRCRDLVHADVEWAKYRNGQN